jgi:site-specific DNA-methyltransferase (adenine-specific)
MNIDLRLGDCLEVLKTIPDNSIDAVITDPPYGIGFMGKAWDTFVPTTVQSAVEQSETSYEKTKDDKQDNPNLKGRKNAPIGSKSTVAGTYDLSDKGKNDYQEWCYEWGKECLRVLKPGGHLLASNSPRMYHRMAIGLEDAGFEIRDQIMWVYGSGFPKSHNIGKAIDKIEGNEREVVGHNPNHRNTESDVIPLGFQGGRSDGTITKGNSEWEGWGTALKPAHEPIVMARKPLSEKSIAENVLKHGTGGINIDGSRIEMKDKENINFDRPRVRKDQKEYFGNHLPDGYFKNEDFKEYNEAGRFPANIIFDEEAGQLLDEQSDKASRFFYCPKAAKKDRNEGLDDFEEKIKSGAEFRPNHMEKALEGEDGNPFGRWGKIKNNHPTVKPTDLMRYLINLITPPNGTILDPFMGSGSTGKAAVRCGVNFIGIEKEQEYMDIAKARIEHEKNKPVQGKLL